MNKTTKALVAEVRAGSRRAVARLITRVENQEPAAREALKALYPHTGQAHIVGVTGPPGSGKSTLVNVLALALRQHELSVGIVAVDPSSPFTGGALLGDRVRMQDLAGDRDIFIRSMASRGSLGGLASTTSDVVKVLDAAGFEVILVETVGAGQAEVDIASAAHSTIVIEAPGMGDEVQTIKAGILEIADVLVVNKADRPGSDRTVRALKQMLQMGSNGQPVRHHSRLLEADTQADGQRTDDADGWQVPVLATVAVDAQGIDDLVAALQDHRQYLLASGEWLARERARSRQEIERLLSAYFLEELAQAVPAARRERVVTAVAQRETDPFSAVAALVGQIKGEEVTQSGSVPGG
ncbi:MAG: methylmalonyl Co-A mutase-associated GTPase MeaB [Candidatus Promineifilaceae bacterium]|nr:methylmalonyl Co-A mutase-associated GTPase MeaB [Candidatus Promineifilaceae bacterium]